MSVQAAIALLNKNNSSTISSSTTAPITKPSITPSWKPNNVTTPTTPPVDNDKKTDSKRGRARTQSGGVASILSKFDQQPPPVNSSTKAATTHIGTTTSSSSSNDSNNDNNNTNSVFVSNNNKKTNSNCNFAALAKPLPDPSSTNNTMTLTTEKPTTSSSTSTLPTKPAIITTPSSSTSTVIRKPPKIEGRQRSATVSAHVAAITRRSRSASVRDRAATINRNVVADSIGHELLAIYQDTLNKLQAAEEEIEKLNQQQQINAITTTSNSNDTNNNNNNNEVSEDKKISSQLRDYEIRIQYLSEKLDQLSQEHNLLERQLDQERKQQRMNSKRITLDTPISPEFRPFSKLFDTPNTTTTTTTSTTTGDELDRRRITVETNLTSEDGEFWNCLLDSYEDKGTFISSLNTSIATGEEDNNSSNINKVINSVSATLSTDESNNNKEQQQQLVLAELLFVKKQLTAVEKGAQIMLERHLRDLEKERQQSRTLAEVVHKQDQLIASLEVKACPKEMKVDDDSNNCSNNQHLLLEQVELQRIELEDKRGLLTRLLDEREELLRQVMSHSSNKSLPTTGIRSRSASVRSSIDVLSEMSKTNPIANPATKHPLSRASSSSLLQTSPRSSLGSHAHGRSTPPPTGPPKNPLPPLPPRTSSSMHSILSPATSWSSADYAAATGRYSGNNQQPSQQHYYNNHQQQHQQQRELVNPTTYRESSQPSNTMMESPLPPHPSTFLNHYSSQQEQPVWLDYQSNEKKQQQLQQQQQQQSPQPQPQTSSTINRSGTIKLKKSNSNGNTTFWKGWKNRLGSR
ncbi:hypothetical protein BDC45DRAFT_507200 [Circinella umbellata]|nr:hypothetical protein BDC45DRAFT_507200 [Circinella umbellata]